MIYVFKRDRGIHPPQLTVFTNPREVKIVSHTSGVFFDANIVTSKGGTVIISNCTGITTHAGNDPKEYPYLSYEAFQ